MANDNRYSKKKCANCGRLFKRSRRKTCCKGCHKEYARKTSLKLQAEAVEKFAAYRNDNPDKTKLINDFLPADDEANVEGFWVPSPEEIEAETMFLNPAKRMGFVLEGSEFYK